MNFDLAAKQVCQAVMSAAYRRGAAFRFEDVRCMVPVGICDRFICEQAELIGYPIWTSAPANAIRWGGF